ncbi:pyridoxal 5'-phosphate synthase [Pseudoalteromonas sp. SMS1]|uniref:pyridoxine/pyridoxamine 5'-phosphate oxidase n=1 Tax=Pseudoalteromonas sp. SMS1 TaxID=2908894 RepID=UPI001F255F79|nr:pyridoxal 5'-phosphate synthase [Pseudoalteromonas sp. SMS1]MCF2858102.1 pyridoxal 5'-phosphate synthase [Pseudoalteromonas sp. SMS1]
MMNNPIAQFTQWWAQARIDSPLNQKSAVCISTIDQDGFPAARFVDLKSVSNDGLVFCTYLSSQKGREISKCNKVALTAWWDHVGYQIRVTGTATKLSNTDAQKYWKTRTRAAQMTTHVCEQSQLIDNPSMLGQKVAEYARHNEAEPSKMPTNWGGYSIKPIRIEFLTFKDDRLHIRELFTLRNEKWNKAYLQP